MKTLHTLTIEGFKSIKHAELALGELNVVIGANGAGKSNLIGVFRLLERVLSRHLQIHVASEPDRLLHHGRKKTPTLTAKFQFAQCVYDFTLDAAQDTLIFAREGILYVGSGNMGTAIAVGHKESQLDEMAQAKGISRAALPDVRHLAVHHFHDTSDSSPAKQSCDIDDNRFFRPDAANLPAYLYWLQEQHPTQFRHIEEHIRLVAPFFERFELAPSRLNPRKIKLEWRQTGSDAYFDAYSLSDGTLRFMCLATLLLQPTPPALILLDEPELGLHPFAIRMLADMLEAASSRAQVLLATQSATLLNHMAPQNVIVAENDGVQTEFRRLDEHALSSWLEAFSLGELWEKNLLGGRP